MGNHILEVRRSRNRRVGAYLPSMSFAALVLWALLVPASGQGRTDGNPLSLRFGDWLTVNPRAKIQLDLKGFRPKFEDERSVFQRRRMRFGADGLLLRDLAYSVRVETRSDPEFRDVFVRYQRLHSFQVQAGRFKIPFGMDQLTDSGELDFVQRSRIGSLLAPG